MSVCKILIYADKSQICVHRMLIYTHKILICVHKKLISLFMVTNDYLREHFFVV